MVEFLNNDGITTSLEYLDNKKFSDLRNEELILNWALFVYKIAFAHKKFLKG